VAFVLCHLSPPKEKGRAYLETKQGPGRPQKQAPSMDWGAQDPRSGALFAPCSEASMPQHPVNRQIRHKAAKVEHNLAIN
jgi:hypothetical protein